MDFIRNHSSSEHPATWYQRMDDTVVRRSADSRRPIQMALLGFAIAFALDAIVFDDSLFRLLLRVLA